MFALFFFISTTSYCQTNITAAEYFIDNDPGPGNGTVVTGFSAGTTIDVSTFNIPTTSLAIGRHLLCVRTKNANNAWGYYDCRAFYISGPNAPLTPNPPTANITAAEYFIDLDPGTGNGTPITGFSAGTEINLSTFNIPTTSLSTGRHLLCVRTKNANNTWGYYECRTFYISAPNAPITPDPPPANITALEYFFDTAPAPGSGTSIPVTPGTDITLSTFNIPTSSVATGWHVLGIRGRNINGTWGYYDVRRVYIQPPIVPPVAPTVSPIVAFEYSIDEDPGVGSGTYSLSVTPSSHSVDLVNQNLNVGSLALGTYKIIIRGKNQSNQWGFYEVRNFSVCNQVPTTMSAVTALSTTSFTANWTAATGATSYQLDVSKDNFATFVTGYNNKTIIALSETISGLTSATAYQYRVRAVSTCASDYVTASTTTLLTIPTAQPIGLSFTSTSNSLGVTFTAASGSPTGYLVIRKPNVSPAFVPVNNTAYTQGQVVSDGVVAYAGVAPAFLDAGLTADTEYYYDVFSYNQSGALYSYLTSVAPLQGNRKTLAAEPTAQPTNMLFTAVTDNSLTASFSPASGGPTGYLVLRKVGSAPLSIPVDGTTYTTTVGTDAVVHNGSATTFLQTGLSQNTEYYYAVYAYNGSGSSINYFTTSPLQGYQLTPITAPSAAATNLVFSNVTPNALHVSYTAATGSPSGYLVVRKTGSNPAFVPQQNTTYTQGQTLSDGIVAYVGTALTFSESGLTPSTIYFYDVFAYNQNGALVSYQTVSPLEGSKSTFTAEPTAQPTNLVFSDVTTSSITASFTAASPASTGYIALRKATSAPTALPIDGVFYSISQPIGDAIVAYVGSALTFVDGGLQPGITYHYQLFSYNGSGVATNYLTTVSLANTGSKITVPDKPVLTAATSIQQNQFTVNWTTAIGAANYRLDVSKDNFVTKVSGFDDVTVSGVSASVTGLETGTAYKYRIRAVNASGTSVSSDEPQQFTIPATPTLSGSSEVTQTSFKANWTAVTGATGYFIDVSEKNDFTTFVTGYQNKTIANVTSELINTLTPGTTYYYRIRSTNTGGTSPNSIPSFQLLIPATPVGLRAEAVNTSTTYFRGEWASVLGATGYRIDVTEASKDFNPSLPGYTDRATDEGLAQQLVTDLVSGTDYRFRVRAVNGAGTSPSSASIQVRTQLPGTGLPLQLSIPSYPSTLTAASANASVIASGGTPPYNLSFHYRTITGTSYTVRQLTATGNSHQTAIDASMLDELGIEFYFKVTDANGIPVETDKHYIYRSTGSSISTKIPFTKSGGVAESYEIFSIPYLISNDLVGQIFEELGGIDKSKWRLVRYQGGRNVDIGESSKIEPGKGYWFNRKENIDVTFSGGTVVQQNQSAPFTLQLEKGWNQIGNPFPYDVDWNDILAANASIKLIGNLKVFNSTKLDLNDESNSLKTWSGGFVHNGNEQTVELQLPVVLKNTAGGRKASGIIINAQLDQAEWLVPITITQGQITQSTSGIGMHPEASSSIDQYDDIVVPRFLNYLEFYANHKDYFSPKFSRDIVPTSTTHTWNLNFESNLSAEEVTLQWNNQSMGNNTAQLLLYDITHNAIVDMKKTSQYSFNPQANQLFKILYGSNDSEIKPDITTLGKAYPNPFTGHTTIPFMIGKQSTVVVSVIDLMGKPIKQLVNGSYEQGIHQVSWDGRDGAGDAVSAGLYFYKVEVNGYPMTGRIIKQQ